LARLKCDLIADGAEGFDPDFPEPIYPIEFIEESGERSRPMFRGRGRLGQYSLDIGYTAVMDVDECAAIALDGAFGRIPATISAQLLAATGALQIVGW
jgi:hypothetical protein